MIEESAEHVENCDLLHHCAAFVLLSAYGSCGHDTKTGMNHRIAELLGRHPF